MTDETVLQTPILLLWFNRPHLARQVLDRLRIVRPARLFVAVDGPRASQPADAQNVADCVALLSDIDWPCTVTTRIRPHNQGCKNGVSAAVDWFFEQVPEGIILEDDCLPDPTFFSYCTELLTYYRYDEQIMHISGANLYGGQTFGTDSYFFSPVPHVWGWASWCRAWQTYDVTMAEFPNFVKRGGVEAMVPYSRSAAHWRRGMSETFSGKLDSWDFQWVLAIWQHNGLCITPNQNLITNIGYGPEATRTNVQSAIANLPTVSVATLQHPAQLVVQELARQYAFTTIYMLPTSWSRIVNRVKRLLGGMAG